MTGPNGLIGIDQVPLGVLKVKVVSQGYKILHHCYIALGSRSKVWVKVMGAPGAISTVDQLDLVRQSSSDNPIQPMRACKSVLFWPDLKSPTCPVGTQFLPSPRESHDNTLRDLGILSGKGAGSE